MSNDSIILDTIFECLSCVRLSAMYFTYIVSLNSLSKSGTNLPPSAPFDQGGTEVIA